MFLVAGESLIDLVATPGAGYIPVPGGAPYNFARALALQGLPVGYLNPFSDDVFGRLLKETLAADGASHLGRVIAKPTSLALVATDERGHPQYSFYREGVADRDFHPHEWVRARAREVIGFHSGGLALVPPDDEAVLEAMQHYRASGAVRALDINMRPQVAAALGVELDRYRDAALRASGEADIVKVSDEDLRHLGYDSAPQDAARALRQTGAKLVVLTVGAHGAWAISERHELFQNALEVSVVDTIGAGDTFFAGFVSWLYRSGELSAVCRQAESSATLEQALQHGAVCAAINLSRKGCQPPTWEQARAWRA